MQYVIYRASNPGRFERSVRVVSALGVTQWVDPAQMLTNVIGSPVDRYHCVLSFAHGISQSGNSVTFRLWGRSHRTFTHAPPLDRAVPMYSFLGMAWAMGRWESLAASMERAIVVTERWNVLQRTANHFFREGGVGSSLFWIV